MLRSFRFSPLAAGLLGLVLAGCGSSSDSMAPEAASTPRPAQGEAAQAAAVRVRVTGRQLQRIDGWGVSVVAGGPADPIAYTSGLSRRQLRRLDRLVFRTAGVNLVRVFGPGTGPTKGNAGPPRLSDPRFRFMRRVRRRYRVRFMLTGGDAPRALKSGVKLRVGAERAYARYLASVLRFARARLRAPFRYSAIGNEIGYSGALLQMTPPQAAQVYQHLAQEIRSRRLRAKLVVGDDVGWGGTVRYARAVLAAPGVRPLAASIASHAYKGTADDRSALAALGRQHRLGIWQTEFSTSEACPDCPNDATMKSALDWSASIVESLTQAQAGAWFAFRPVADSTHGANGALLVRDYASRSRPYYASKRFHVFRQYSSGAPPRSRRLATEVSGTGVTALGFGRKRVTAVVLANRARHPVDVALDFGQRKGRLSGRRTSPGESFRAIGRLAYRGAAVGVTLPAQSVTTYQLE